MSRRLLLGSNQSGNMESIDLGLSVNWATCNVGATKPTDYGLYFSWGETQGYEDAKSKYFDWSNYKFYKGTQSKNLFTKYVRDKNNAYDKVDNKSILDLEDDAAHVNMGGDWRMPSFDEYVELDEACNREWVTNYQGSGINGYLLIFKKDRSKELFFPAAGACYYNSIDYLNSKGFYWFNELHWYYDIYATCLEFEDGYYTPEGWRTRFQGYPVRAVQTK